MQPGKAPSHPFQITTADKKTSLPPIQLKFIECNQQENIIPFID